MKKKILIVEDKALNPVDIHESLHQYGYLTDLAASEIEIENKIKENKPDLIVLDLHFQEAAHFTQLINLIRELTDVPVIYLVIYIDEDIIKQVEKTGIAEFLVKPFIEKELFALMSVVLNRYESQRAVKEIENRYSALFNSSQDCIYIVDLNGRLIDVNDSGIRLLGYSREELGEIDFRNVLSNEQSEKIENNLKELAKDKKETGGIYRLKDKNGADVIIEATSTVLYRDNKPYAIQAIARDITEKERTERSLRQSEEKYRTLFEKMVQGITYVDCAGKIISVNPAVMKMLGIEEAQIIGKAIYDPGFKIISEDGTPFPAEEHPAVVALREAREVENTVIGVYNPKENDYRWVNVSATPLFLDGQEKPFQVFTTFDDITGLKRKELENKRMGQILLGISENLPVTIIEIDDQGYYTEFSGAALRNSGLDGKQVIGMNALKWDNEVTENITKALDGKSTHFEYTLRSKNGPVYFESWFFYDKHNNGGAIGFSMDITEKKLAEEKLLKLSAAVEQSATSILILDKSGKIEYTNPKFTEVSGYSCEEIKGRHPRALISDEVPDSEFGKFWQEFLRDGKWKGEYKHKRKNGEEYWEEVTFSPIKNKQNEITNYLVIKEEITARKVIEKQLIESEDRYRRLVEMAPDIVVIHCENQIVYVNKAAAGLYGSDNVEDLLGRSPFSFLHPDDRHFGLKRTREALRTGKSLPFVEERFLNKKGEAVMFEVVTIPTSYKGKPAIQIIARNIEQRKKAEEALRISEEKFRAIFENAPLGIAILKEGTIIQANLSYVKIFGFDSRAELINTGAIERVAPAYRAITNEAISQWVKSDEFPISYDFYGQKKDGSEIPLHIDIVYIDSPEGRIGVGMVKDISEIKNREDKIKASLKEKEILLKEIHHRVKNNLQLITSLLSLQSDYIEDKKARLLFEDSCNRIRTMAMIHERLYQTENFSEIDFHDYLTSLINYLKYSYSVNTSEITAELYVDDISLTLDHAIPCGMIINELVSNAYKYAFIGKDTGKLSISFKRKGANNCEMIVADDGTGFPEKINFRKSSTLGLILVENLVSQLQGSWELDNSTGTRFIINFPYEKHVSRIGYS